MPKKSHCSCVSLDTTYAGLETMREQIWEASLTLQEQVLCLYIEPKLGDHCIHDTKPSTDSVVSLKSVMFSSYAVLNNDDACFTDQMLCA